MKTAKNILKIFPWTLAFAVSVVCVPFVIVGSWTISFMEWLYSEGR